MEFDLIDEGSYEQIMQQTVLPALEHCKREGWIRSYNPDVGQSSSTHKAAVHAAGAGPGNFHYICYESARFDELAMPGSQGRHQGLVIISHGFTEFAGKYTEMAWYFLLAGYTVCIIEYWGHGLSGRGISDPNLVWVDSYKRYVEDLAVFCQEMAAAYAGDQQVCLYAHSMGGGIAASLMETHPTLIDRAVLSSPMIAPQTGVPLRFASAVLDAACAMGMGQQKVPGHHRFKPEFDPHSVGKASPARMKWIHGQRLARSEYQTSAATYGWVQQAIALSRSILKKGLCEQVEASTLLFQAGSDSFVLPGPQERFVEQVKAGGCDINFVRIAHASHELYTMPNEILGPYMNRILDFFAKTETLSAGN